jgi:hypothetical protein
MGVWRHFEASWVARRFSRNSVDNGAGVLERFLVACGLPAWDVTRDDVDWVAAGLSVQGLAASTRRGYVQAFHGFHAFPAPRKASEIEAAFGLRLASPVDEFNAARHVGSDSLSVNPPPAPERMEEFGGGGQVPSRCGRGRRVPAWWTVRLAGPGRLPRRGLRPEAGDGERVAGSWMRGRQPGGAGLQLPGGVHVAVEQPGIGR